VSVEDAEAAHRQLASRLAAMAQDIVPVRRVAAIDEAALLGSNLVSGMISAHDGHWEPPQP